MTLRDDLITALAAVGAEFEPEGPLLDLHIRRDVELHGQPAIFVRVDLDARTWPVEMQVVSVEGTFTTELKSAFGGVDFAQKKDIPLLMASKVRAVLNGTAEEVQP